MGKKMEFKYYSPFANHSENYVFINNASGLQVFKDGAEVIIPYEKAEALKMFIRVCIDLDEWKHSWHDSLDYEKPENKKNLREIMKKKIEWRKREIEMLEFGITAMSRNLRK